MRRREFLAAIGATSIGWPNAQQPDRVRRIGALLTGVDSQLSDAFPIEQPTGFLLAINVKTAKQLGLDVLPSLLATADEVIK